jgi:hypothetical protein
MAERPPHPALGTSGSVGGQLDTLGAEIDRVETEIAPQGRERLARTQRRRTQARTTPSAVMSRRSLSGADLASARGGGSELAFADGWLQQLRSIGDVREDGRE